MLGLRDFMVPIHDDMASKSKVMQQESRGSDMGPPFRV